MAMKNSTKVGLTIAGTALLTAVITVRGAKRTIRKRCRRQVKRELGKIPLLTEDYIDEQANEMCEV